jgi:hypothetical protein
VSTAAKLEVPFVHHPRDGFGITLARGPGKLAGREPRGLIPDPGLESRVEVGKLRSQARFTRLRHGSVASCRVWVVSNLGAPGRAV